MSLGSALYQDFYSGLSFGRKNEKAIFEITPSYINIGFSGSSHPFHQIPLGNHMITLSDTSIEEEFTIRFKNGLIYTLPLEKDKIELFADSIRQILLQIYQRYLLLDPRSLNVVVVESPRLPHPLKYALSRVFLEDLLVPSVTFFPASVMSLLVTAKLEGIVVQIGLQESVITPVFDGRPLETYSLTSSVGEDMLLNSLKTALLEHGSYKVLSGETQRENNFQKLDSTVLDSRLCAFIIKNLVFASPLSPPMDLILPSLSNAEKNITSLKNGALVKWYIQSSIALDYQLEWTRNGNENLLINIPGWIREHVLEVVFYGNHGEDIHGITPLLVKCLKSLPLDLRRRLSGHIITIGNIPEIPNFRNRLISDLISMLITENRWKALAEHISFSDSPANQPINPVADGDLRNKVYGTEGFSVDLDDGPDTAKEAPPKLFRNSGILFPPSICAWVGASIATSANIEGTEISLENLDQLGMSYFEQLKG